MSAAAPTSPRILVLRGGAIGDFLVTLPVLQALRRRWPQAEIDLLGYPHIAELARAGGLVQAVLSLERTEVAQWFSARPTLSADQCAYIRRFDLILSYLYDPDEQLRQNLRAAGARQVLYGSPLVTDGHAVEHLLRPLETLALYEREAVPELRLQEAARAAGRAWLDAQGLGAAAAVTLLHPGSGSPQKNWPLPRFLELAAELTRRGQAVCFSLGEADAEIAAALARAAPAYPLLRDKTLVEVAAVLSHCAGYVGNDSGISHLAAAVGCPTLALFGPSDPARWAPRGRRARFLQAPGGDLSRLDTATVLRALGSP